MLPVTGGGGAAAGVVCAETSAGAVSAVAIDKARMDLRIELLPLSGNELVMPAGWLASPVPSCNALVLLAFIYAKRTAAPSWCTRGCVVHGAGATVWR